MHKSSAPAPRGPFSCIDQIGVPVFVLERGVADIPIYAAVNTCALEAAKKTADVFLGHSAVEVYGPKIGNQIMAQHVRAFKSGKPHRYEVGLPKGKGNRKVVTTLEPITNDDGRVTHLMGTSHAAERHMPLSADPPNETQKFVYRAAKNLAMPLKNISFLTRLLKEGGQSRGDTRTELIDLLETATDKASSMIEDVLSLVQSPSDHGSAQRFDVAEVCEDIAQKLDPRRAHRLTTQPTTIYADKVKFQVLMRNLMDYAMRHGNRQSLSMSVRVTVAGDNTLELTFEDNGSGFDDADTAFQNILAPETGQGYRLYAIQLLVQDQGGKIDAQNKLEGGSIVTVTLPGRSFDRMRPFPTPSQAVPLQRHG